MISAKSWNLRNCIHQNNQLHFKMILVNMQMLKIISILDSCFFFEQGQY